MKSPAIFRARVKQKAINSTGAHGMKGQMFRWNAVFAVAHDIDEHLLRWRRLKVSRA